MRFRCCIFWGATFYKWFFISYKCFRHWRKSNAMRCGGKTICNFLLWMLNLLECLNTIDNFQSKITEEVIRKPIRHTERRSERNWLSSPISTPISNRPYRTCTQWFIWCWKWICYWSLSVHCTYFANAKIIPTKEQKTVSNRIVFRLWPTEMLNGKVSAAMAIVLDIEFAGSFNFIRVPN